MMITPEAIHAAMQATAAHRQQVQGFYYKGDAANLAMHVVRDLTLPPAAQVLWELSEATPADYDASHAAMLAAIDMIGYRIALDHIGQTQADEVPAEVRALVDALMAQLRDDETNLCFCSKPYVVGHGHEKRCAKARSALLGVGAIIFDIQFIGDTDKAGAA